MTVGILGKKVGMTQVFSKDGEVLPVTVIQAGPCTVTQVKTIDTDGYNALQIGYKEVKPKKLNKPKLGHLEKNNLKPLNHLMEFRLDSNSEHKVGEVLDASQFQEGQKVTATGKSIGKGFMGTVVRHGFSIGPKSHGSKSHRGPGSIGAGTDPGRVLKGQKMAGRMGAKKVTVTNLEIVKVDLERNLILVKGSVPGSKGGLVVLKPFFKVGSKKN